MHALITGVTGQDGAYLTQLLLSRGYKVVGTSPRRSDDKRSLWRLDAIGALDNPNFSFETLDVTCSSSVNTAIREGQFEQVYNLAAQSFVAESFKSPIATSTINYMGVLHLLEAIRVNSPHTRFYQASTSEMFGLVNCEHQSEETPFHPRSPYAVAKAAAHYCVQNYREAYGLYACCGILFNHESPLRGIEFVTRKITDGIARIVTGKADSITLGNIDASRDWGHAQDYVRAMNLMLERDVADDFVIATGVPHTVRYLLRIAFAYMGLDYEQYVKQDERYMRPSEVPLLCGDAKKARDALQWAPVHTFEDMIIEMLIYDLQRHGYDQVEAMAR